MSRAIRAGAFRVWFSDVETPSDYLEFERDSQGVYAFTAWERDNDTLLGSRIVLLSLERLTELRDVLNQAIATDAATIGGRQDNERVARARAEREAADAAALRQVNERLRAENDELRKQARS